MVCGEVDPVSEPGMVKDQLAPGSEAIRQLGGYGERVEIDERLLLGPWLREITDRVARLRHMGGRGGSGPRR